MPFRQTIGISLALLMASTGAFANAPEKTSSYHPAPPPNAEPGRSQNRFGKMRFSQKRVQPRWSGRPWGPMHVTTPPQIGQAAWYDLVGRRTASGERLDKVTPTAAHLSLPLGSCAKVTDLDTGQAIIVKINDRGPYSRHFIIDLSPRAAQELGMRHEGVAAVAVEPVASGDAAVPTEAVYQDIAGDTTQ